MKAILQVMKLVGESFPLLFCVAMLQMYSTMKMTEKTAYLLHTFGGGNPPDLWFGIPPRKLYDYFAGIGSEGRAAYQAMVSFDVMPCMPSYTLLLGSLLYRECKTANAPTFLVLIFPMTMIFDAIETIGCGHAAKLFPRRLKGAYLDLINLGNQLKWISLGIGCIVLSFLFVKNLLFPPPVQESSSSSSSSSSPPVPTPQPSERTTEPKKEKSSKSKKKKKKAA